MTRFRFLILPALVLPAAAFAQESPPQWMLSTYEDDLTLAWGTPDTDHVEIMFHCPVGSDVVAFTYFAALPDAPGGLATQVRISGNAGEYAIAVMGTRLDLDDLMVLEGGLNFDETLSAILLEDGTFTVSVEGEPDRTYTTAGGEKAFATIAAACPVPEAGFADG